MTDSAETKRRVFNVCVAAVSFFAMIAVSYCLSLLGTVITPGELPVGMAAAFWAISLGAGAVPALCVYRPRPVCESEYAETVPVPGNRKPAFLVPGAVCMLLAVNIFVSVSGIGDVSVPSYPYGELIFRAILGCTVYPVLEETFFRGALLSALRERDDPLPWKLAASALTAVAFAAVHRESGFVFALAAGIILTIPAPYEYSGKRRFALPFAPIAAHALYNLALYVSLAFSMTGIEPVITLSVSAGIAAIVTGVMMLGGRKQCKEKK